MQNITIKSATVAEKLELEKNTAFELPYKAAKGKLLEEWPVFLALNEHELLGYVSLEQHPPHNELLWIEKIAVKQDKKRKGIASALLEAVEIYALKNNITELRTWAHQSHAFLFWKARGYLLKQNQDSESELFVKKLT